MTITDKPNPTGAHWHVLGAGAMGCLWAAAIAQQPTTAVSLLLRDSRTLATYRGAIRCHNSAMEIRVPALALDDSKIRGTVIDNLLVATKAQHTLDALESVRPMLSPQTRLVLLQNGLMAQRETTRRYGEERVYCLTTSHGAWLRAPFDVVHAGAGQAWLGQLHADPKSSHARVSSVLGALPASSLAIRPDPDIEFRLWHKFAINCAVNALTVVYGCRNGELLTHQDRRNALMALCKEISSLMKTIPEAPPIPDLETDVIQVLTLTAQNYSSTLQDVQRGRETELSELNGYLIELADHHQLACPGNRALLEQVAVIESRLRRDDLARSN